MTKSDKKLGMDRLITRRDFVHGVGTAGVAVAFAGSLSGLPGNINYRTS